MKVKVSEAIEPTQSIQQISRETYGSDVQKAPNGHSYWDADWGIWTENDAHFRERIKKLIQPA